MTSTTISYRLLQHGSRDQILDHGLWGCFVLGPPLLPRVRVGLYWYQEPVGECTCKNSGIEVTKIDGRFPTTDQFEEFLWLS
jgi:hypothetical protein